MQVCKPLWWVLNSQVENQLLHSTSAAGMSARFRMICDFQIKISSSMTRKNKSANYSKCSRTFRETIYSVETRIRVPRSHNQSSSSSLLRSPFSRDLLEEKASHSKLDWTTLTTLSFGSSIGEKLPFQIINKYQT